MSYPKIRAIKLGILLLIFSASAYAIEPPLEERGFYSSKAKGMNTYYAPWPDLKPLPVSDEDLDELKQWILQYRNNLSTWPPRYADEKEITTLIKAWQKGG